MKLINCAKRAKQITVHPDRNDYPMPMHDVKQFSGFKGIKLQTGDFSLLDGVVCHIYERICFGDDEKKERLLKFSGISVKR
jgi:hypothetical protein